MSIKMAIKSVNKYKKLIWNDLWKILSIFYVNFWYAFIDVLSVIFFEGMRVWNIDRAVSWHWLVLVFGSFIKKKTGVFTFSLCKINNEMSKRTDKVSNIMKYQYFRIYFWHLISFAPNSYPIQNHHAATKPSLQNKYFLKFIYSCGACAPCSLLWESVKFKIDSRWPEMTANYIFKFKTMSGYILS